MTRADAKVLVVDDNELMRATFKSMLRAMNVGAVDAAIDGVDALQHLARGRYDAVITDWQMPRLDGLGLLRAIRATRGLERLPVVIVTGFVTQGRVREAAAAGVDGFLPKPFAPSALEQQLRSLFGADVAAPFDARSHG